MITVIVSKRIKASTEDEIKRAFKNSFDVDIEYFSKSVSFSDVPIYSCEVEDGDYYGDIAWKVFENLEDVEKEAKENLRDELRLHHNYIDSDDYAEFYEIAQGSFLDDLVDAYIDTLTDEQILEQSDLEWEYNDKIRDLKKLLSDEEIKELLPIEYSKEMQEKLKRDFNFTEDEMWEIESLFGEMEDILSTFGKMEIRKKKHNELLDQFEEDPVHFIYYNDLDAQYLLERDDIEINTIYAVDKIFEKYNPSYFLNDGRETNQDTITDPETNKTFITFAE